MLTKALTETSENTFSMFGLLGLSKASDNDLVRYKAKINKNMQMITAGKCLR